MNHLHMKIRCKDAEAYNKVIDCVTVSDDVSNEGLTIWVGTYQWLDKEKWEALDEKNYVISAQDDMANPGCISIGGEMYDQEYGDSEDMQEAMDNAFWIKDDQKYSWDEIKEKITEYTKDW